MATNTKYNIKDLPKIKKTLNKLVEDYLKGEITDKDARVINNFIKTQLQVIVGIEQAERMDELEERLNNIERDE